jgi:exopolyphosphatase/guanosine-5'-triphosphate,3'-diphosphate pyrophosphatase
MPRFAAIDVGSNAIRMRIVEASAPLGKNGAGQLALLTEQEPQVREILSQRAPVRLGTEVFLTGKLTPQSIGQACTALREFKTAMDAAGVSAYRATATSAVREAQNGSTLAERARREAGIDLEIIEGVEEARLIQLAVVRRLGLADKNAVLIDVGGGSTEITHLEHGEASFSMSLPLGTVRLLETFLRPTTKIDKRQQRLLTETIERAFVELKPHLPRASAEMIVGTGGNIDTLSELAPAKGAPPGSRIIDVAQMNALSQELFRLTAEERQKRYNLRPDRADTIVPACAIYSYAAGIFGAKQITAPGVGLKDGVLEEIIARHFSLWDLQSEENRILSACSRLGRRYAFDENHGERVSMLSSRLFDDLKSLHGLGPRDRLLLRAAATLHDIGDFVRYDGHHKHSFYIIAHSDIMGLSRDERSIVANVARYHRKSPPDPSHPNFRELDKDARARVRMLAAILRIADALDREHLGKVTGVRASVEGKKLVVTLEGKEDRTLEEWTLGMKAEMLRDVFVLDVVLAQDESTVSSDKESVPPASVRAPARAR